MTPKEMLTTTQKQIDRRLAQLGESSKNYILTHPYVVGFQQLASDNPDRESCYTWLETIDKLLGWDKPEAPRWGIRSCMGANYYWRKRNE